MIGEPFDKCVCKRRGDPHELCNSQHSLIENGLEVCMIPKKGEKALAFVFDGCIVSKTDPNVRCDGIFLLKKPHEKWIVTVELKGGDLYKSYEQLHYTRNKRQVYKDLVQNFKNKDTRNPNETSFIISNKISGAFEKEKLNKLFSLNVRSILQTEASKPPVNLRIHFN